MKILVLYYSAFGYVTIMANEVAEGARSAGASVDIKRVPETLAAASAQGDHLFQPDQSASMATVDDLANYDAIIVGSPTRFGRPASQMAAFLDQAGDLARQGALSGKVGGAFTSPSSQYGGQETASMSLLTNLLHFGMIVVGPPFSAATMADTEGQRHPSPQDLEGARRYGRSISLTAQRRSG
jgi:NAD(P)H dehydrogenase (quinone)